MSKPDGITQEQFDAWPKCAIANCTNKCCLRLGSKYCYPHSTGIPTKLLVEASKTLEKEAS